MTAIAMSGGGAKGSFQVGVLKTLDELGILKNTKLLVGTSVGALNAGALAHNSIDNLIYMWNAIKKKSDILKWGLWNPFKPTGIYSTKPLEEKINKYVVGKSWCEAVTCSVSLVDGEVRYVSNKECSLEDFKKSMLTSSLIPFFMKPVHGLWYDGGIRENTPLAYALNRYDKVIVITTNPISETMKDTYKPRWPQLLNNLVRCVDDVMQHETLLNDLRLVSGLENKKVVVISPLKLLNLDTLEFNQNKIQEAMKYGMEVASRNNELDF